MPKHLNRLDDRVFSIEKLHDGTFKVREECDGYYSQTFTADELRELAKEIIELSRQ